MYMCVTFARIKVIIVIPGQSLPCFFLFALGLLLGVECTVCTFPMYFRLLMGGVCGCVYNKESLQVMDDVGMSHTSMVHNFYTLMYVYVYQTTCVDIFLKGP